MTTPYKDSIEMCERISELEQQNAMLVEALSELENFGELVLSEIDSSQTGWYFQFQAKLQQAKKALAAVKEGA
jgi:hypothetical protein